MEKSKIEWTDHTFNPWIGCQRVSAACDHCYAERLVTRYGWTEWGPRGTRRRTAPANWRKPVLWDRRASDRERVFCASLADVMDNRAPDGARDDLYRLIEATQRLDWLLLTKRPENFRKFRPAGGWPRNVWLGVTAEDQDAYDRRWPLLAAEDALVRFISYEPATGALDLSEHHEHPDWLIWGGESGPGARTMNWRWAEAITAQCRDRGIAVFGKQWGTYRSNPLVWQGATQAKAKVIDPPSNGKGGALLHGKLVREFPEAYHSIW